MELSEIQARVREASYFESRHARNERSADGLTLQQVETALLSGEILEQYDDTGRGESCLLIGFSGETAIHVVCGWSGPDKHAVVLITVYKPGPPKFSDPWTRGIK